MELLVSSLWKIVLLLVLLMMIPVAVLTDPLHIAESETIITGLSAVKAKDTRGRHRGRGETKQWVAAVDRRGGAALGDLRMLLVDPRI